MSTQSASFDGQPNSSTFVSGVQEARESKKKVHLNVLLRKDFLTLWRNRGFLIAFIVMPILLMFTFIMIQNSVLNVSGAHSQGSMVRQSFMYSTSSLIGQKGNFQPKPFHDVPPIISDDDGNLREVFSSIQACKKSQIGYLKMSYSKIAVVAADADLRDRIKQYFLSYVFPINNFCEGWTVDTYAEQSELFDKVRGAVNQDYCFAVTAKKMDIDVKTQTYDVEWDISFNKGFTPDSGKPNYNSEVYAPDIDSWNKWLQTGSVSLMQYLAEYVAREIHYQGSEKSDDCFNRFIKATAPFYQQTVGFTPMTTPDHINMSPSALENLSRDFPFFLMIVMLIPFYYLTSKIAAEKESKAREGMKMMGLTDDMYFLSLFIFYFTICLGTSFIVAVMAGISIFENNYGSLFFFFVFFYALSFFGISFAIVAFLPTKRSSAVAATLFHIISYYVSLAMWDPSTSSALQYGMSLLPNICMNQCIKQFFWYNLNIEGGAKWTQMGLENEGYRLGFGMLIIVFDLILYLALGLYFDQVIPSQYGIAKPWNFLCKKADKKKTPADSSRSDLELLIDEDQDDNEGDNFERVTDALKKQERTGQCLKIRGLRKEFGQKIAVHKLNLTMYEGQIFALLGHNGAGKTTTISMLTGLIQPTKGKAVINGSDVLQDMDEMRNLLGVCPQHDVLFDFLTPEDHLRLFAAFKGTPSHLIENLVQKMLVEIDLVAQKQQLAKTLSGGQKRKLSVAIAMIGDSKIIMLDEPTSGMDTTSRRKLWDMLKRNKNDKIIILTTHYMDEADILGDRIAIMAEGQVQCTGSPLFLKSRYGVGYNLVIAKKERQDAPHIDEFVLSRIRGATKMQEVSSEIQYQLPSSSSAQFKKFFEEFDSSLDALGIRSYGIGITTLEEVFLNIGHGEEVEKQRKDAKQAKLQEKIQAESSLESQQVDPLDNYTISEQAEGNDFWLHLRVLIKKRLLMQVRDKKALGIDFIFPILLIIVGIILSTTQFYAESGPVELSAFQYPTPLYIAMNEQSISVPNSWPTMEGYFNNYVKFENPDQINLGETVTIDTTNPSFMAQIIDYDSSLYNVQEGITGCIPSSYGQIMFDYLNNNEYSVVLDLNSTSWSVAANWGAFAYKMFLRKYLEEAGLIQHDQESLKVKVSNNPFPMSAQYEGLNKSFSGSSTALLMTIAWMMISDSWIQAIIRERERNIKHQIMVSGSSLAAYWLSNYIADILFQLVPAAVAIAGIHLYDIDAPKVEYLFALLIFSNPAFIYAFSFLFAKDENGSLFMKMVYFVFGIIAPITVAILQIMGKAPYHASEVIRWFFMPVPIFAMTSGFISISNRDAIRIMKNLSRASDDQITDPLAPYNFSVAGPNLLFLALSIPVLWAIVIGFEKKAFDRFLVKDAGSSSSSSKGPDGLPKRSLVNSAQFSFLPIHRDEDILKEEKRVAAAEPEDIPVRVSKIRKTYGSVVAVDKISFGLEYGECFALLGVSGAGKTNCFKCLTGEIYPTKGEVSVNGHDVTTSQGFQQARKQIGYCPQFDAIFEGLTVKEHLDIYAALKGIDPKIRSKLVQRKIQEMDLDQFVNVRANTLSGGNKRKLSVAIAMIGNPPIVFLDEPSTGVDPQAKRFMWDVISKISIERKKSAVMITTHSMEEAEALCTKMGIMVKGRFKCFGSSQHIKDKFGTGYEIEMKIRQFTEQNAAEVLKYMKMEDEKDFNHGQIYQILEELGHADLESEITPVGLGAEFHKTLNEGQRVNAHEFLRWQFTETQGNNAIDFLEPMFEKFEVLEHYGNSWKLKVSRDEYSIGFLFGKLEEVKEKFDISEYSITQTTLEQIFNNFALEEERLLRKTSVRKRGTNSLFLTHT